MTHCVRLRLRKRRTPVRREGGYAPAIMDSMRRRLAARLRHSARPAAHRVQALLGGTPVEPAGERNHVITLDYPVRPVARYGYGKPAHPQLETRFKGEHESYRARLEAFLPLVDALKAIPLGEADTTTPWWHNGWYQGLDAVALYGTLAVDRPRRYLEVGSGNSTKFVRRAITDHGLPTTITSIDPRPRAEIDALCDRVVRTPFEEADLSIIDELDDGDVFFVDGSHRVFENSDATVAFIDVLPRLRPGVLVHIHDIFLPWDYPPQIADWYFSEHYLLAAWLLAGGSAIDVILPNFYVCLVPELHAILSPLWEHFTWSATATNGTGFWFRKAA